MENSQKNEPNENELDYVVTAWQLRNLKMLLLQLANHIDAAIPQVERSSGQVLTSNWKTGYRASLHILQFVEGMVGKINTQEARRYHNAIAIEQESRSKSVSRARAAKLVETADQKRAKNKRKPKP